MHVRFEDFEFCDAPVRLLRAGRPVKLQLQPARLLALLLERPGEVIAREEVRARLWGAAIHLDHEQGINFAVRQIRKALDDQPDRPRFLETVRREGYRFIAEVSDLQPVASPPSAPPQASFGLGSLAGMAAVAVALLALVLLVGSPGRDLAATVAASPKLAVMPFELVDPIDGAAAGTGDSIHLGSVLTEEMIVELASRYARGLGIIDWDSIAFLAGDSSLDRAAALDLLDADYYLRGTVSRAEGRLRLSVRLWTSDDLTQLWAGSYESEPEELPATLRTIADLVAAELGVAGAGSATDSPLEVTVSGTVYRAYLRGRMLTYEGSVEQDHAMFQEGLATLRQVVQQAPDFARGHAVLALAYLMHSSVGSFDDSMRTAEAAAERAIDLEPAGGEGYAFLGAVRLIYRHDWRGARELFEQGIALAPGVAKTHQFYSWYLSATGQHADALASIRRAIDLDPIAPRLRFDLAQALHLAGRHEQALRAARIGLQTGGSPYQTGMLSIYSLLDEGRRPEALEEAARIADRPEQVPASIDAWLEAEAEDFEGWLQAGYRVAYEAAAVNARAGRTERALELLDRACREHEWWVIFAAVDPSFDALRGTEPYRRLGTCLAPVAASAPIAGARR